MRLPRMKDVLGLAFEGVPLIDLADFVAVDGMAECRFGRVGANADFGTPAPKASTKVVPFPIGDAGCSPERGEHFRWLDGCFPCREQQRRIALDRRADLLPAPFRQGDTVVLVAVTGL